MFDFKNKKIVITGGGSGIGKATAILFAQQGAEVHIVDINQEEANKTCASINENGGTAIIHSCDITNQQKVKEIFSAIQKIDVLINSAGISHIGKADTTSEEDFDKIYTVNIKGVYNSLHEAIPLMVAVKKGVILNLASVAGIVGIPERFAYSMSKGAVTAMTLSVAKDYINDGIRCNCISPARVYTPFVEGFLKKNYPGKEGEMVEKLSKTQPIGRMARPDEIAYLILYLCSDEASFITGCDYPIDGGFIKLNN
jgi:NAD(P)-dependent dehydrogenase (short-subunit alcohol dehydrogenase family)